MPAQKVFPLMENGPEFKIEVSILKDVATVMIDTTGLVSSNVAIVPKKGGAPIKGKTWQQPFYNSLTGIQISLD